MSFLSSPGVSPLYRHPVSAGMTQSMSSSQSSPAFVWEVGDVFRDKMDNMGTRKAAYDEIEAARTETKHSGAEVELLS